jgi:hypothetical protein
VTGAGVFVEGLDEAALRGLPLPLGAVDWRSLDGQFRNFTNDSFGPSLLAPI